MTPEASAEIIEIITEDTCDPETPTEDLDIGDECTTVFGDEGVVDCSGSCVYAEWAVPYADGGYIGDSYCDDVDEVYGAHFDCSEFSFDDGDCDASIDECGDVSYEGCCSAGILNWCEDDALESSDCTAADLECGWVADSEYFDCVPLGTGAEVPTGVEMECPLSEM